MADWKDWSDGWIKEGHYLSYMRDNVRFYEHVIKRDLGHWEYNWPEAIDSLSESGPFTPDELEITQGYQERTNTNQIWQMIFGQNKQCLIYIELPTDLHRHGIPKVPKPSTAFRKVSHFDEYMSQFHEPTFLTEHFMMRPENFQITFSAYNPEPTAIQAGPEPGLVLNILLNKLVTERVGTAEYGELSTPVITNNPTLTEKIRTRFSGVLGKLYRQEIPCRPITLLPVRAPGTAPAGV